MTINGNAIIRSLRSEEAWLARDYVYEEGIPYHARVYIDFGAQPGLLERDWETKEVGFSTAPMHIILAHELIHADRVMTENTSDDGLIAHFFEEPTLNKGPIKYVEGVPAEEL